MSIRLPLEEGSTRLTMSPGADAILSVCSFSPPYGTGMSAAEWENTGETDISSLSLPNAEISTTANTAASTTSAATSSTVPPLITLNFAIKTPPHKSYSCEGFLMRFIVLF